MKDCIKCKDCKFFNAWRTSEGAEKHGQIYECSKLVISCPSPDDYCSKAEKKAESSETKQGLAYADQETMMPAT